ncbi:hypothetical protein [Sphingorhabdus sp. M41]|uniref:hypothetical protein n=1 Tax=Sphingorhabdus sp. M41 TaxID=1806885 RepID=UPI00078BB44C|nr:hypothetical protein [Sphingorhabdus sp. M41]AMO72432.1 hypothetical protein AZE99_11720 [Sphingorhabdus sp. M41]
MHLTVKPILGLFALLFSTEVSLAKEMATFQDRTVEVISVIRFVGDLRTGKVPDGFRSKLRIYKHPSRELASFAELSEYASQCPLHAIDLPYPMPGVGPVLVRWKCPAKVEVQSVGFYFESGRLAAASIGLPDVPLPVEIKVVPHK